MAKVIDFIEKNKEVINKLTKCGIMPLSFSQNYDIYNVYRNTTGIPQMQRYKAVSVRLKISVSSVRKAKIAMEKPL